MIVDSSAGGGGGETGGPPIGGTFALGVMPPPLTNPKANEIFGELMASCFGLEQALMPHRPPSSTIAVNRHAQFKPHTDSGNGAGQRWGGGRGRTRGMSPYHEKPTP